MAKSKRKKLVGALDDAFSRWIRARDKKEFGIACHLCKSGKAEMACHLISRSKYSVRWDPANAFAGCRGCNLRHEFYPHYYVSWWLKRYGEHAYLELVEKSNQPAKLKTAALEKLLALYQSVP